MISRMSHGRTLVLAAVLLAGAAALGFSQAASDSTLGHPSEPGVLVVSVQSGSPAQTAGVVRGDIITEINGAAVNSPREVEQAIDSHKQGDTLQVKVRHGDEQKTLSVALGERNGRPYMGVLLFPEEHWRFGMHRGRGWPWSFTEGALVARVASGGPADKAGIRRGDVILSVDGTKVDNDHSLSSLIQEKKPGDVVTLSVTAPGQTPGKPHDVKVTLGTSPDKKTAWLGIEYRQPAPTAFVPWRDFPPAALLMPRGGARPFNAFPSQPGMSPLQPVL
jgi:S1-C subfamily serine protease